MLGMIGLLLVVLVSGGIITSSRTEQIETTARIDSALNNFSIQSITFSEPKECLNGNALCFTAYLNKEQIRGIDKQFKYMDYRINGKTVEYYNFLNKTTGKTVRLARKIPVTTDYIRAEQRKIASKILSEIVIAYENKLPKINTASKDTGVTFN